MFRVVYLHPRDHIPHRVGGIAANGSSLLMAEDGRQRAVVGLQTSNIGSLNICHLFSDIEDV